MRIAVDLRPLLTSYESGVAVYLKSMLQEFLKADEVELDLFYQSRKPCEKIHALFPTARWIPISNTVFHLKSIFTTPKLPKSYFPIQPDLIWLPDRRPFYRSCIPVVMTLHDAVPEILSKTLSLKGRLWFTFFSLKKTTKYTSGFLFSSSSVAARFPGFEPNVVTYEGAKISKSQKRPALLKKGLKDYYFFLAPKDPRKRFEWVFRLARDFPKQDFIWAGLKDKDTRFAQKKLMMPKNLTILGEVSEEEKAWLYHHAKAYLAISRYEGFDLTALEAHQANCPLILSDIAVHHELYKNALFVQSYEDLHSALLRAKDYPIKKAELRGEFTWKRAAKEALLLFRRVVVHKD